MMSLICNTFFFVFVQNFILFCQCHSIYVNYSFQAKCSMYWPAQDNVEMHYGPISVVMVKEEEGADYTTRTLQIKNVI